MTECLLFASCDPIYYHKFGPVFLKSAAENGNRVHIHIINDNGSIARISHRNISYSSEHGSPATREYFSCNRFLVAPARLRDKLWPGSKLLVLDVDSIIRGKIVLPDTPVGLYLREPHGSDDWVLRGTRVAAGCVMFDREALPFAQRLAERIAELPSIWLADQIALAETYDEFRGELKVHDFGQDPEFMDWTFRPDSLIWTGKGDRKYRSPRYLWEFKSWERLDLKQVG